MPDVKYVSAYTHPYGMNYVKVEAVSLVTGLSGTGSDPPPTPQRAALLDEMKRREVANPNEVLASRNTSMVLVRAFLRPGIQEGDRFDVEVRIPSRQRNDEPPRRLAAFDPADRNGRARPANSRRPRARHGRRRRARRSDGRPESESGTGHARPHSGWRHRHQVASAGPRDQPRASSRFASARILPTRSIVDFTPSSTAANRASRRPRPANSSMC